MPLKIDLLVTTLDYGGAELQVVALAKGLQARGYEVRVISLLEPAALTEQLDAAAVPFAALGMRKYRHLARALGKLVRLLRERRPLLVHAHMVHANIMARLAKPFIGDVKVISTAHNTVEGGRGRDYAYRLTNWLSDLNTTISEAATARFVSAGVFPRARTITVYNGIDTERFAPARTGESTDCFTWVAVGRLVEQKDYPTLLRAFALVKAQAPEARWQLNIVGKGEQREALVQLAARLALSDRVAFLGTRSDVERLYQAADGFVLASAWEGYGLVVAEAMACGLPVVVTDSGGPGEIVGRNGQYGFLVPPGDPSGLARALREVMAMPADDRKALGERARAHVVAHHGIESVLDRWEAVYRAVLNRQMPIWGEAASGQS